MRIFQQIGGAFGTALLAIILSQGLAAPGVDVTAAFSTVFWWSAVFAALCVIPTLYLHRRG
jgi:asparagine N-glycosylation enzyme membrane subunit Stt3